MGVVMGEQIRYISLFSGVEACSVAWHHMDNWLPQVFAEFDEFPSAVLKHQFPHVPNVGDVTKHDWKQYKGQIELIVGGSPCQSFSVAGKRLGLDDPRGNLALHFLRIVDEIRPTWFLFENVPGLLSSDDGRDFAAFLRQVEEIGYGCAYRVLDAQYFGVPQRRRRVFVVGHIDGDWRRAAAVLFEPEGLSGNPPTRNTTRQDASTDAGLGTSSSGRYWNGRGITNTLTAKGDDDRMPDKGRFHGVVVPDVAGTVDTHMGRKLSNQDTHNGLLLPVAVDLFNQLETGDVHCALRTAGGHGAPAVMQTPWRMAKAPMSKDDFARWEQSESHPTLNTFAGQNETRLQAAVTVEATTFDARGNGEGDVVNTLVGDHQSRVTDYTALALQEGSVWGADLSQKAEGIGMAEEVANTVAPGTHPGHGNHVIQPAVIDRAAFNQGKNAVYDPHIKEEETMPTLVARGPHAVGQPVHSFDSTFGGQSNVFDQHTPPLKVGSGLGIPSPPAVTQELAVRRLTPIECERLQGFPDNWTQIPWKGKPQEKCPDGPRFKCMGNSMAVPVMRWIGEGIEMVNRIPRTEAPQQEELGWL